MLSNRNLKTVKNIHVRYKKQPEDPEEGKQLYENNEKLVYTSISVDNIQIKFGSWNSR